MNRLVRIAAATTLSLSLLVLPVSAATAVKTTAPAPKTIKSVILMIPDGMSVSCTTLARYYLDVTGKTSLNLDAMASGLVRTQWANGFITDSAPGATAFSTGFKSDDKHIATLPIADKDKPKATILEAAKLAGKATGLVATSEIMHATPADFAGHDSARSNYDAIGEQMVYNNIDVVLGAGDSFLTADVRADREDILGVIKANYTYTTSPTQALAATGKLWASFSPKNLAYDMDRNPANELSLAQMTGKAIELLSKDSDGFFLMVEGSKVDWAAHANDTIGILSDTLAFDKAVGVALEYAKKSQDTIVISVTDHGNSGISIGSHATDANYSTLPISTFIDPLKKAKLTIEGTMAKMKVELKADKSNMGAILAKYYGLDNMTAAEIDPIVALSKGIDEKTATAAQLQNQIVKTLSDRANIAYTTYGHTGEDVVLYTYSPNDDRLMGVVDNTDIAKYMTRVLNLDLAAVSSRLFVDAKVAFEAKGATVEVIVNKTTGNHMLVATKGTQTVYIPVNKNIAYKNDTQVTLPGVSVYISNVFYTSQDAVNLIK